MPRPDDAMPLLPEILAERRDGAKLELDLGVPAGLACFDGHFPGQPILPGVLQVDWSARYARERLGVRGEFSAAENLKFHAAVMPGMRLTLSLAADGPRVDFELFGEKQKYASGRLVFRA
jgi:3-hydroxymyristoyl/3-hydroxydecanoyl-(acyl carrier protein) dehydratase